MSLGLPGDAKEKRRKGSVAISTLMVTLRAHQCCKLRVRQFGFLDNSKKPAIAIVFLSSVCPTQHFGTLFSQADNG